jgi:hypothetical protein
MELPLGQMDTRGNFRCNLNIFPARPEFIFSGIIVTLLIPCSGSPEGLQLTTTLFI